MNRGRHNFDEVRFEYYRDSTVLLEAFKGDRYDFRAENSARNWATAYDFPAVQEGRVVREEFPVRATGDHAGLRVQPAPARKFQDERVRRAFNLAFDFEDINRTIFYGLYQRVNSYFAGTELASSGPAARARSCAILESVRDKVPAAVFTDALPEPGQRLARGGAREPARGAAAAAGGRLRAQGPAARQQARPASRFAVEFLGYDPSLERYVLPYKQALERIGIGDRRCASSTRRSTRTGCAASTST